MNLKERIEEIVFNNVKRKNISCTNCGQEFLSEQYIAIDQATTDILKAVREEGHPCPFCKATTCYEYYNCNGCETHAEAIEDMIG